MIRTAVGRVRAAALVSVASLLSAACDRPSASPPEAHTRGRKLYEISCAACHQVGGEGKMGVASPLAGSEWVVGPAGRLTRIALHGVRGEITVMGKSYNLEMPGFATVFSNADLAAILTYIRQAWGHRAPSISEVDVATLRQELGRRDSWTEAELLRISE